MFLAAFSLFLRVLRAFLRFKPPNRLACGGNSPNKVNHHQRAFKALKKTLFWSKKTKKSVTREPKRGWVELAQECKLRGNTLNVLPL